MSRVIDGRFTFRRRRFSRTQFPPDDAYHAFGVVEGVETAASKSWSGASVGGKSSAEENDSRVLLKIRVCLVEDALSPTTRWLTGNGGGPVNAPDERERRDGLLRFVSRRGAAVTISRVASLTPPLREMAALLATCRAGGFAGAASAFLRPSRAAPETTAFFAGTRGLTSSRPGGRRTPRRGRRRRQA